MSTDAELALFPAAGRNPDAFTDRKYQVEAVSSAVDGLRDGGRGQVLMACGTGKTKVARWVAERLVPAGGVVVIVAPTVGLVDQTLRVWAAEHDDHTALAVCGDASVNDDSSARTTDILERVTTDPEVIAAWLRAPSTAAIRLIVGTHVSSHIIGQGLQMALTDADLLVIDEAHRTAGSAAKHVALVHDDDVLPATRRLYMTATARIFTKARRSESDDGGATNSMDDEEIFGPVLYNYPFSRAIDEGYLDDYRLVVIGVTEADVLALLRNVTGDGNAPSLHTAMVQAALARAASELGLRRVIAFCPRIKDAREFADTFEHTLSALPETARPRRPLHAEHIHGGMINQRRQRILERLAHPPNDGWSVISNSKCLSEGINVPTVDCVAFTKKKKSVIDIVQGIGRALRRDLDGTGIATILVPILLPDGPDHLDEQIDAGDYDVVWQVVNALRAHDDLFATALEDCRTTGQPSQDLQRRITYILPDQHPRQHQHIEFVQHLTIRIIKTTSGYWWEGYRQLVKFHEQWEHTSPKNRFVTEDDFKLGAWTVDVRAARRKGCLSADRVAALDELGFDWDRRTTWTDEHWEQGFAAAQFCHALTGKLDPPSSFRHGGVWLRRWLQYERDLAARGKMPADHKLALDKLGMEWEKSSLWRRHTEKLEAYYAEYGCLPSKSDPDPNVARLGNRIRKLREVRQRGELDDELIDRLDKLGMVWDPVPTIWETGLKAATRYYNKNGHLFPEHGYCDPDGFELADWLAKRRRERNSRRGLAPERIAALDAIGMIWDPRKALWDQALAAAKEYYEEFHHLSVPNKYRGVNWRGEPLLLAKWLTAQRKARRDGQLSDEQIAQLDAVGMDWDPHETAWQANLAALTAYYTEYGNLDVPDDFRTPEGILLDGVLSFLRQRWRAGTLEPDRKAALDAIGIIWDPRAASRAASIAALTKFHAKYGHIKVPHSLVDERGRRVGDWLSYQRRRKDEGGLSAEEIAELDALGMIWELST